MNQGHNGSTAHVDRSGLTVSVPRVKKSARPEGLLDQLLVSTASMLERVDMDLPGMEAFSFDDCLLLTRLIERGDLVYTVSSLGWAFWPTNNSGYYDARLLRMMADFIAIQNKPFEDEYDRYCQESAEAGGVGLVDFDEFDAVEEAP